MERVKLDVRSRAERGGKAARAMREVGEIPGVIYSSDPTTDTEAITVGARDLRHAVSGPSGIHAILDVVARRRQGAYGDDQGPAARPGARPRHPHRPPRGAGRPDREHGGRHPHRGPGPRREHGRRAQPAGPRGSHRLADQRHPGEHHDRRQPARHRPVDSPGRRSRARGGHLHRRPRGRRSWPRSPCRRSRRSPRPRRASRARRAPRARRAAEGGEAASSEDQAGEE